MDTGYLPDVTLLRLPGVYRAQDDTSLLIDAMRARRRALGRHVLDVGTGTGALAVAAVRAGAESVTAVDLSLRSVVAAWANSRLQGAPVSVRWGDLFGPVAGRRFDLILTNPPYVPSRTGLRSRHRIDRCWDGGLDGRALLDRICEGAPAQLTEGGTLLLVQSELSGECATLERLEEAGLLATVTDRARVPFGPVLRAREALLRDRGLLRDGQDDEELIVIEARRG